MILPEWVRVGVEQETERVDARALGAAALALSRRYRGDEPATARLSDAERTAYLAVRAPATYAAIRAALDQTRACAPSAAPRSVLDLCAGPGVALWAALELFPTIERAAAIERDARFIELGARLLAGAPHAPPVEWICGDVREQSLAQHDLVIASYALGELTANAARRAAIRAWAATRGRLLVIEPGTPRGFAVVRDVRDAIIAQGGRIAAPCPHADVCPMAGADWCHFAARLERSRLHRRLKAASLSFEDEKFSYVAADRDVVQPAAARVIRRPRVHSGWVELTLCAAGGVEHARVTRSQGARYRAARKADWGDAWDSESPAGIEPDDDEA